VGIGLLLRLSGKLSPALSQSSLFRRITGYGWLSAFVILIATSVYVYGAIFGSSIQVISNYVDTQKHAKDRYLNVIRYTNGERSVSQLKKDRELGASDFQKLRRMYVPLHLVPLAACLADMHDQFEKFDDIGIKFVEDQSQKNKDKANEVRLETLAFLADSTAQHPGLLADGKCDLVAQKVVQLDSPFKKMVPAPSVSLSKTPQVEKSNPQSIGLEVETPEVERDKRNMADKFAQASHADFTEGLLGSSKRVVALLASPSTIGEWKYVLTVESSTMAMGDCWDAIMCFSQAQVLEARGLRLAKGLKKPF
jgi:hypothetical protein